MAIYLGILAVGVLAIVVILMNENKSSKPSPVDLLNSLEVDENPDEGKKDAFRTPPPSSFLNRLNLNENKSKKDEEHVKTVEVEKKNLSQSAVAFEQKLKKITPLDEKPVAEKPQMPSSALDKSTKDENISPYQA